jgi:hypothetical protein
LLSGARLSQARPLELELNGIGTTRRFAIGGRLPHPTLPPDERKKHTHDKEPTEDRFVVSSEPERQVDIKVVTPVVGKAGRDSGKWAAPIVGQYYEHFDEDDCDQRNGPLKLAAPG